jgi:hypothetical protein
VLCSLGLTERPALLVCRPRALELTSQVIGPSTLLPEQAGSKSDELLSLSLSLSKKIKNKKIISNAI